jgi:hypothetical protein
VDVFLLVHSPLVGAGVPDYGSSCHVRRVAAGGGCDPLRGVAVEGGLGRDAHAGVLLLELLGQLGEDLLVDFALDVVEADLAGQCAGGPAQERWSG